jgi:hypothetical protein
MKTVGSRSEESYLKGFFSFKLKRLVENLKELVFMTFAEKKIATMNNRIRLF